jgi:hypothetical protein
MRTHTLICLSLLLGGVSAQNASYTYINQKLPYKNQSPAMLTALDLPKIGKTFRVQAPGGGRYNIFCLATGVSNPNIRFSLLGGYLYTSAELLSGTPRGPGTPRWVTISFSIPNSSQLLGVKFYQQVCHTWYGPFGGEYTLSRGGVATIGR